MAAKNKNTVPLLDTRLEKQKRQLWLCILWILALLPHGLGALLMQLDEAPVYLYMLFPYVLIPLCALLIPFFAGKRGLHPIFTFFPIGLGLLLSPVYPGFSGTAMLCMLASLVSGVAGTEYRKKQINEKAVKKKKCAPGGKKR